MKETKTSFWDRPFVRGVCLALIIVPLIIFEIVVRYLAGIPHTHQNSLWYIYFGIVLFALAAPNTERFILWQTKWMRKSYLNAEKLEVRPVIRKIAAAILYTFYILFVALAVVLRMLL